MEIHNELADYYSERPEYLLNKDLSFEDIFGAKNRTLDFYLQNKGRNVDLEKAKSVPIIIDNMVGFKKQESSCYKGRN